MIDLARAALLDPGTLDVAVVAVALRAAWLLPDWLEKWRRLSRGGRRGLEAAGVPDPGRCGDEGPP